MMPGVEGALRVAHELGLPVHPVDRVDKRPLIKRWPVNATTDERTIVKWWTKHPDANIGVPAGQRTGRLVLDVDPRHGGSLAELERRYGQLPDTVQVATGSGGRHLHFARPEVPKLGNHAGQLPPGIDVRCDGGQVVVPESVHASGQPYEWLRHPSEVPLAALPESLLRALLSPLSLRSSGTTTEGRNAGGSSGASETHHLGRNVALTQLAGTLRRAGVSIGDIEVMLLARARACGLPVPEVERLMGQVAKWSAPPPWLIAPAAFVNDARLDVVARAVLRALCDHADAEGICWPGQRQLCEVTGISQRRTVYAALRRLEALGRIEMERSGARRVNRYQLLPYPEAT